MLALNLPSKHVLPEALSFAQTAIQSPDPLQRAAACTVIVDIAEGCADSARKQLLPILQVNTSPHSKPFRQKFCPFGTPWLSMPVTWLNNGPKILDPLLGKLQEGPSPLMERCGEHSTCFASQWREPCVRC